MTQCPCGIARLDCTYHKPEESQPSTLRIHSGGRGSGRTTRQLQALPKGGWFFCTDVRWTRALAAHINRTDIKVSPIFEKQGSKELIDPARFSGYVMPGIDVDHWVWEVCDTSSVVEILKRLEPCVLRAQFVSHVKP